MEKMSLRSYMFACAVFAHAGLAAQAARMDGPAPAGDAIQYAESGEARLACLIVDGVTGAPIPGAEVLLLAEANTPIAAELPIAMRFVADDDGLVTGRVDKGAEDYRPWSWICARADGYGQRMEMRSFDEAVVRLSPGGVVPIVVRDWRDQPVADVLVGFCSGCGHTPDLTYGRTGRDGSLTLTGVDLKAGIADFYLVHEELDMGYLSPDWSPGRGPLVLRTGPGLAHRGVVVDEQGAPVAGVAVGTSTVHRGPWARTGQDGSFVLCGLDFRADLWVHVDGRRVLFETEGVEGIRLQLPPRAGDNEEGVQVVDLTDERRAQLEAARERDRDLAAARELAWPRVPVRGVGLPADAVVTMGVRGRTWELDEALATGAPVALPDGEFYFFIAAEDTRRMVRGDRAAAVAAGSVRLRWFGPTRIEGRVVDERGEPLVGRAFVAPPGGAPSEDLSEWVELQGALSLPTTRTGPSWLYVESADHPGRRIVSVDLPPRGDDVFVDVGEVVVGGQPAHRFERSDGTPLEEGTVQVLRAGWVDCAGWSWQFEADAEGYFWLPDLQPGDALLVRSRLPSAGDLRGAEVVELPSRFVIGDVVPEVFTMHGGEARVEVDAPGAEVHAYATFGDRVVPLDGATVVRGLEVRDYRVLVGGDLREGLAADVEVVAPTAEVARPVLRATLR